MMFILFWIFWISLDIYSIRGQTQNNLGNKLGSLYLGSKFFGANNGPPTYQRIVSRAFKNYLDNLMKMFLDDFIIYDDMFIIIWTLIYRNLNCAFRSAKNLGLI